MFPVIFNEQFSADDFIMEPLWRTVKSSNYKQLKAVTNSECCTMNNFVTSTEHPVTPCGGE
jgi:hypothetical protein